MGSNSADSAPAPDEGMAMLALGLHPVAPAARLRERLLSRIGEDTRKKAEATPIAGPEILLSGEGKWSPLCPGVYRKHLYYDAQLNTATFLLRFEAGAELASHRHGGTEQCLVLEGEVEDGGAVLRAGDFQTLKPGSVHSASRTKTGCLLLIVAAEPHATKFV